MLLAESKLWATGLGARLLRWHLLRSVAVLAEIPLKSPRKLLIFMIIKRIYRIKVSKNKLLNF